MTKEETFAKTKGLSKEKFEKCVKYSS